MSGGHYNYLSYTLANELNFPSGSYGIGTGKYSSYDQEVKETRAINPMCDKELSEMMYDVDCLLHSLEWWQSGDIGEERYFADVKAFKEKWFCRYSEQSIKSYREDIKEFLENIDKGL